MKNSPFLLLPIILVFFSWSCSSEVSKEENSDKITIKIDTDSDEIREDLEEGMEDLEDGLKEMTSGISKMVESLTSGEDGENVRAADFRELKAILPDRLLSMERTSHTGERSGVKGLQVSVAEAEYEDDDRYLKVSIVDGGGLPLASISRAGWSMVEVDKEDDNGYERTTTIDGHKAFEKYNNKWEEGKLAILLYDRFIVALEGKGIEAGDLRRVYNRLDLDDLENL